jgi:hypothetical protein
LRPDYGWSKSGEICEIKQPNTYEKRGNNRHSLVMTMTKEKIINWRLITGSYKGVSYLNYMKSTIKKMGTSVPFMDNATIHKTKKLCNI